MSANKKRSISILMMILMLISLFTPSVLKAAESHFMIKKAVLVKYTGNKKTVKIPKGVKKIGSKAFYGKTGIKKVIIPSTVKTIGKEAFSNCRNLQSIKLPNGIKKIENKAFSNCSSLEKIIIPESMKTIGSKAFANCKNLTSLTIKNSKTKVKDNSFLGCKKIDNMALDLTDSTEDAVNESAENEIADKSTEKKIADKSKPEDNANKKEETKGKKSDTEKQTNTGTSSGSGGIGGGFAGGSSGGGTKPYNKPKKPEKTIKSVEKISEISLEEGSKKEDLTALLPKLFTAVLSDETKVKIAIKSWKGIENINLNALAKYVIEAEYDLPVGVTGAKKAVKTAVEVRKKKAPKTLISVETEIKEITVEYGADWKKVEESKLPKTLSATLSDSTKISINGVKWTNCNTYRAGKTDITAIYNLPEGVTGSKPLCTITVNVKPAPAKPKLEFEDRTYYYKDNPVITIKNMPAGVKAEDIKVEAAKELEISKEISSPNQYTVSGNEITLLTDGIFENTVKNFAKNIELDVKVTIKEERVPGSITIKYAPDPSFDPSKKRVVKITTSIPEITVEVGTRWVDKTKKLMEDNKLPSSFTVELSDGSTREITIKGWGFVGTRTATTPGVPKQSEAEFELPADIEKEDSDGKKVKFYANVTIVPKKLPMSLKTNKSEYYYEENPEITIENWQSHNSDIKISRIKNAAEIVLDKDKYEFNSGKIIILTNKVFEGEVTGDVFTENTDLILSVTVGTDKLPELTIKYLAGKKDKPNTGNAKFTAEAVEGEDGTTPDGFVIFPYEQGKTIKIILKGKDGTVLKKEEVQTKLRVSGRYDNSSEGSEFMVESSKITLEKWNGDALRLKIPSDYDGIKYNKKIHIIVEIEGYGANEVKIIAQ